MAVQPAEDGLPLGQLVPDGDPFRVDLLLDDHRLVALRGDRGLQRGDPADGGKKAVAQLAVLLAHALEELDAGGGVGEAAVGQELVQQPVVAELVHPGEMRAEDGLLLSEVGLALIELQTDLAELALDGGELRLRLVPVLDYDLEAVVERGDLLLDLVGGLLQAGEAGRLAGGDDRRRARGGAPAAEAGKAGQERADEHGGGGQPPPGAVAAACGHVGSCAHEDRSQSLSAGRRAP